MFNKLTKLQKISLIIGGVIILGLMLKFGVDVSGFNE